MRTSASTYSRAAARLALLVFCIAVLASCGFSLRRHEGVKVASWYGPGFHGKRTASGEEYNMYSMTCAHKTLPFGTKLKLTNIVNGKKAIVIVNDRGPFVGGRDIDLSKAAAARLGIVGQGTGHVKMEVLGRDMRYAKYIKDGNVSSGGGEYQPAEVYTIQVAAFGEKENAEYVLNGLRLNHRRVYITEAQVDGKRFYRVRVGKFRTQDKAEAYARKLADEGYTARVTPFEL